MMHENIIDKNRVHAVFVYNNHFENTYREKKRAAYQQGDLPLTDKQTDKHIHMCSIGVYEIELGWRLPPTLPRRHFSFILATWSLLVHTKIL